MAKKDIVIKHLKGDMKMFEKEREEDRELIGKLKKKKKKRSEKEESPKHEAMEKKHEKKKPAKKKKR